MGSGMFAGKDKLKIVHVKVDPKFGRVTYVCEEDCKGMIRMGAINCPRGLSVIEADVLRRRLRNRRLGELESIIEDVLKVRVGVRADFGDVTPYDGKQGRKRSNEDRS